MCPYVKSTIAPAAVRVRRNRSHETIPEAILQEHKVRALSCPSPTAVGSVPSSAALTSLGEQAVALHHWAPSNLAPSRLSLGTAGMPSYPNSFLAAAEVTSDWETYMPRGLYHA